DPVDRVGHPRRRCSETLDGSLGLAQGPRQSAGFRPRFGGFSEYLAGRDRLPRGAPLPCLWHHPIHHLDLRVGDALPYDLAQALARPGPALIPPGRPPWMGAPGFGVESASLSPAWTIRSYKTMANPTVRWVPFVLAAMLTCLSAVLAETV